MEAESKGFKIGDRVNWPQVCGGYGFVRYNAGIVKRFTAARVEIEVARKVGSEWVRESKVISPHKLLHRDSFCPQLDSVPERDVAKEADRGGSR